MKRPILTVRWGRRILSSDWTLVVILAPFPEEEQEPGALCAALLNLEVRISTSWPWVSVHAYCADRLK